MAEIIDIVNENDEVVGQAEREQVHRDGLICRMVLLMFYTQDKHIILQRRSMTKVNSPGKLTTSVSGHVEQGLTYDEAVVKETFEETGVVIDMAKLSSLGVRYAEYIEDNHGSRYVSNVMRASYAYPLDGGIESLKIEVGEATGFEIMSISDFRNMQENRQEELAPYLLDSANAELVDYIDAL